jgi:hypothetical protein
MDQLSSMAKQAHQDQVIKGRMRKLLFTSCHRGNSSALALPFLKKFEQLKTCILSDC